MAELDTNLDNLGMETNDAGPDTTPLAVPDAPVVFETNPPQGGLVEISDEGISMLEAPAAATVRMVESPTCVICGRSYDPSQAGQRCPTRPTYCTRCCPHADCNANSTMAPFEAAPTASAETPSE